MNKRQNTSQQSPRKNQAPLLVLSVLATILISTGCSSQRHKKASTLNLLKSENELLLKLENERSTPTIKRKLERDQTLLEAEWHLREAIRTLREANEALTRAL